MSKRIDESKIERIRRAAVETIAVGGIPNSSVATIAERAGVSVGYLYRHYESKEELVNDLLTINYDTINAYISQLLDENKSLRFIIDSVVRHIVAMGSEDEMKAKFIIMLLNDFSSSIKPELLRSINDLAEELIRISRREPFLRGDVTKEDIFLAMIIIPMHYLAMGYNGIVNKSGAGGFDAGHISERALNMIFKD